MIHHVVSNISVAVKFHLILVA